MWYLPTPTILTDQEVPFPLVDGHRLPLRHELFDHDAIILSGTGREVTLKAPQSPRQLHLSF